MTEKTPRIEQVAKLMLKQELGEAATDEQFEKYWETCAQRIRNTFLARAQEVMMLLFPERNASPSGVQLAIWTPAFDYTATLTDVKVLREEPTYNDEIRWEVEAEVDDVPLHGYGATIAAAMHELIGQRLPGI